MLKNELMPCAFKKDPLTMLQVNNNTDILPTYLPTLISNEMQVWRYGRHCNKMSHINRS